MAMTGTILEWNCVFIIFTVIFTSKVHGKPAFCLLPPDTGPCNDRLYQYYYSDVEETCNLFIFGGCHVNDNVFNSFEKCMSICSGNETATEQSITTTTTMSPKESLANRFRDVPYLVLENGTGQHTFTFDSPSSYIQIESDDISSYQIRNRRSVSLEFRTRLPHAILLYHGILDRPSQLKKYELYIMLDQGQLTVKHLFGDHSTTVVVGKGLNRDKFHRVNVMIDPNSRQLSATIDDHDNTSALLDGLMESPFYGAGNDDLNSTIFIGGLKSVDERLDISYLANPFVGCIRNVELATSPFTSVPLESITALVSSRFNVLEHCLNKCDDPSHPCSYDSRCINHYDHVECDCFYSTFKGDNCRYASIPVLTLFGHSYVTFTVYEWMDRVHSDANRIGLHFRTKVDNSILFYAAGEIPSHNHIGVTLKNQTLLISIHFGEENFQPIVIQMGNDTDLTDGEWHYLAINHRGKNLRIQLDDEEASLEIEGTNRHLYIDPDIHIGGGGPRLQNRQGLFSSNNFVGCIKEVYFNAKSVLWELSAKRHQAQYHGSTEPVIKEACDLQNTLPITIPFAESGFRILNPKPEELNLKFKFRTKEVFGTLAYSDIRTLKGEGFWELQVKNENVQFVLYSDKELAAISASKSLVAKFNKRAGEWISLQLKYSNGDVQLITDKMSATEKFAELFQLSPFITLGTSTYKPNTGFVGCIGNVEIGEQMLDARQIVGSGDQIGDIALDNCMYADPCSRPKVCEHDGKCSVQNGQVSCDCSETGYIGKHCHFAIFKRTCEELALLGYTESGVYKIDIDGNGPFSPAHVKCRFETDSSGETKTIVEHNLLNETDIWNPNEEKPFDFTVDLKYREFSPEMILSLVSQSVQCSQYIKYDCYKAHLDLQLSSWFTSADPTSVSIVSIGDAERNTCPCYSTKSCAGGKSCNCDSAEGKWLSDEGYFADPERVGITSMYFMVPSNLTSDSASRITVGPLECVEANTQRYVVTFKTFGSFLEAPGWKTGDLAFSFRTTRSSAILLYQPLLHPQHNAFSVFLANEHELVFRFILNGGPPQKVVVRSQRPLSGGDWQQVWIDYDLHQVRFQINAEHQMINLPDGQVFGPFESTMYIAGAPSRYLEDEDTVKDGLIGCFRGLVMNSQVVDLYSYMKFHKADIVKDCSPSCDPNPCKNRATCIENWGSFTCQCQNPWSQSGEFCEHDLNVDGLTFLSQSSFIREANLNSDLTPVRNILTSNFIVNLRTYDSEALVLYANDNLNNFVQLHIEEGTSVIFTWNHGDTIRQLTVGHKALNHGKPIQIAITRNYSRTALYVNNESASIPVGISLLTFYSREPWTNSELETFSPPRPLAPVSTYYQLLLGGYDINALIPNRKQIPGLLGCLRGLKIGIDHVKLGGFSNNDDVLDGCKMVCDNKPCKNNGLCLEDFTSRTYSCDCVHTSYYGKTCNEERGATFQGESYVRRRFKYVKTGVSDIVAHFGFSASYAEEDTLLLAILLPGQNYSILLAINEEGHFMLKEQLDGQLFEAVIRYQNFIDGSRHSIYFERHGNETLFIVDHEEIRIFLNPFSTDQSITTFSSSKNPSFGDIFVAGVNEETTEFSTFKKFKGCLSNIYVKIGELETSPLEEYMGYKRKEAEAILDGEKFDGIKVGPCAAFSLFRRPPSSVDLRPGDHLPDTTNSDSDWMVSHPQKVQIQLRSKQEVKSGGITMDNVAILCATFLGCIILFVVIYVYRLNKKYRRRMLAQFEEDDAYFTHRGIPVRYSDPHKNELEYTAYEKVDPEKVNLVQAHKIGNNNFNRVSQQGNKPTHDRESTSPPPEYNEELAGVDDENASSEASSPRKGSLTSESSSTSLNHTEVLDNKVSTQSENGILPNCSRIGEITESDHDDDQSNPRLPSVRLTRRNMSTPPPVYLSPHVRTYERSPIAMIGGPRYDLFKRHSKDSILSLD